MVPRLSASIRQAGPGGVMRPTPSCKSVSLHAYDGFRGGYRGHEELGQAVTGMEVRFGGDDEPSRAGWTLLAA
jgi:hypothetical protein